MLSRRRRRLTETRPFLRVTLFWMAVVGCHKPLPWPLVAVLALAAIPMLGACTGPSEVSPTPSTTGVPAGTTLKPSGSIVVKKPGTVLDALDVSGTIEVKADHVTIKRTRVRSSGHWLIRVSGDVSGTIIEDTEVDGMNSTAGSVAIGWTEFTAVRVNLHGTEDGIRLGDRVTVEDSWIHDLLACPTCHSDGMQSTGGSHIVVRHNRISWPKRTTSCVLLKSDLGPIDDVVIDGNVFDGGGYTIYSVAGQSQYAPPTNIRITNNRFGRHFIWGVSDIESKVTWSGNVWNDTGKPVSPRGT